MTELLSKPAPEVAADHPLSSRATDGRHTVAGRVVASARKYWRASHEIRRDLFAPDVQQPHRFQRPNGTAVVVYLELEHGQYPAQTEYLGVEFRLIDRSTGQYEPLVPQKS